jgi:hypothetical protein
LIFMAAEIEGADLDPMDVAAWHSRSVTLAETVRRERDRVRDLEASVRVTTPVYAGSSAFARRMSVGIVLGTIVGFVSAPLMFLALVRVFLSR